jgi:hypothetical protein
MDADLEKVTLDKEARRHVYDQAMGKGLSPTIAETASALSRTPDEIAASF